MKYAREDYQRRIQDSEGLIPDKEPVFLLRGQDEAAPATLETYANIAALIGADQKIIDATREQAQAMRQWQIDHPESVHSADM